VGTNRYAYAQNDPVNRSDPGGHLWSNDDTLRSLQGMGPRVEATPVEPERSLGSHAGGVGGDQGEGSSPVVSPQANKPVQVADGVNSDCCDDGGPLDATDLEDATPGFGAAGPIDADEGPQLDPIPKGGGSMPSSTLVCRGGTCTADGFRSGSGVTQLNNGTLTGVSTQSKPGATVNELAVGLRYNQIGVTTVGDINQAGGTVTPDGHPGNPNHATVNGLTADQLQNLFNPTVPNPIPKDLRGR
jgi:hypothetical protein